MATPNTRATRRKTARTRPGRWWAVLQVVFALTVLGAALLAVLPSQSHPHFQARVVASEGSAWVAAAGVLVLLTARSGRRGAAVAALAVAAIATASVPILRARAVAGSLRADLEREFGPLPADPPARISRQAPLVPGDLLRGLGLAEMRPRTMVYATIDRAELLMDVYTPPAAGRSPAPGVLVIHGGAWRGGMRAEFNGLSRYLAARGYVVVSMDYRLGPAGRFPAPRDDVATVIKTIKAHAGEMGLDPSRLALLGRSAGAQIALLEAYAARDPAIRGVVSFYGPTDLVYGYEHPADPNVFDSTSVLVAYLGGHLREQLPAYRAASPIEHVGPLAPPTLLIHGTADEMVEVEQSRRLDRRLTEAGVPHLLLELPWASHGCDFFLRGPCGQVSTFAVEQFLARVLRPEERR